MSGNEPDLVTVAILVYGAVCLSLVFALASVQLAQLSQQVGPRRALKVWVRQALGLEDRR